MLLSAYGYPKFEFDEENDLKNYTVFLCDFVHGVPAWKPLYLTSGWSNYLWGLQLAAETLHVPTTKGWDYRVIDGYCYPTIIETTEEEAKQREPIFRQKIRPYLEDFDGVWEPFKTEIIDVYKRLKESQGIKVYKDIEKIENISLAILFEDFIRIVNRREAEIHMLIMVPVYYIFGTFQKMWQEFFGTPSGIDPLFSTLMSGFEGAVFQMNKEAWGLAREAMKIGMDKLFLSTEDNEKIWEELQKSKVAEKLLE